jgi:hypothetical protein
MSKAPEWLPDWEDESQYPDPQTAPLYQWAWEFLRRNEDYWKAWKELIAPFSDKAGKSFDTIGARAAEGRLRAKKKFSLALAGVDSASNDNEPLQYLLMREMFSTVGHPPPPWVSQVKGGVPFVTITTRVRFRPDSFKKLSFPFTDHIREGQAVVWFNLNYPLKSQLARAQALLEREQKLRPPNDNSTRKRLELYPNYLRILDAQARGVSFKVAAIKIFPKLSNEYPNPIGVRMVRDSLEAAQRLRDRDYLLIPTAPISKKK